MKKLRYTIAFAAFLFTTISFVQAQDSAQEITNYTWGLGGQLGIQAGGAIPIPMSALSGNESAVNVTMKVNPLLSLRANYFLSKNWRLFAEFNYAATGFEADARVTNQRIRITDESGQQIDKYFTGVSHIEQSFFYFEIPVYVQYSISKHSKLHIGIYASYMSEGVFKTTAEKGFTGVNPNEVGAPVNTPILSDFSNDLRSFDAGVLVGYAYSILPRLQVGVRINFSPIDIFSEDYFTYTMHQLRGSLILSYDFYRK